MTSNWSVLIANAYYPLAITFEWMMKGGVPSLVRQGPLCLLDTNVIGRILWLDR